MKGIKPVILALAAAILLKMFFFDFIIGRGNSMEPTIKDGSIMIVSRLNYGIRLPWQKKYLIRWGQPKEGDVVIFYSPFEDGELLVKRCVAIDERDSFYALGDNWRTSYDSRSYGPVPLDNIIGKVLGY